MYFFCSLVLIVVVVVDVNYFVGAHVYLVYLYRLPFLYVAVEGPKGTRPYWPTTSGGQLFSR